MTPKPTYTAIVNVYLPFIGVSLGYVTVGGYWQDAARVPSRWKKEPAAPVVVWVPRRPPPRWGSD